MFEKLTNYADVPARMMMALIFVLSGMGKVNAFQATQGYMEAFGLPGILLPVVIIFEIGGGLMLIAGLFTRYLAVLLAGFSLLTALVFHNNFSDQIQMIMFLKNVAMAGGFLLLTKHGAPHLSLDGVLSVK